MQRQPSHQTYCTHRLVVKDAADKVTWEGSAFEPWGSSPRFHRCRLCGKTEQRGPTPAEQPKHGTAHPHARPRRWQRPAQGGLFEPWQLGLFDQPNGG